MGRIDDGQLSDEDEEALGKAIAEMVDDFGPDFDEEGQPLEEGESDRIATSTASTGDGRAGERRPRPRSRGLESEEEVPA